MKESTFAVFFGFLMSASQKTYTSLEFDTLHSNFSFTSTFLLTASTSIFTKFSSYLPLLTLFISKLHIAPSYFSVVSILFLPLPLLPLFRKFRSSKGIANSVQFGISSIFSYLFWFLL